MLVEEGEFKGRPVLTIKFDENDQYPFSFGVGKAKKILGSLDEIKAFVEKYDQPKPKPQEPADSEDKQEKSDEE